MITQKTVIDYDYPISGCDQVWERCRILLLKLFFQKLCQLMIRSQIFQ